MRARRDTHRDARSDTHRPRPGAQRGTRMISLACAELRRTIWFPETLRAEIVQGGGDERAPDHAAADARALRGSADWSMFTRALCRLVSGGVATHAARYSLYTRALLLDKPLPRIDLSLDIADVERALRLEPVRGTCADAGEFAFHAHTRPLEEASRVQHVACYYGIAREDMAERCNAFYDALAQGGLLLVRDFDISERDEARARIARVCLRLAGARAPLQFVPRAEVTRALLHAGFLPVRETDDASDATHSDANPLRVYALLMRK